MTLTAPAWLWLGALVAGGVVALHFLARHTPPPALLPTARFVPQRAVRWPSFARRPSDLLLLGVRVAAVLLLAAALARPGLDRERPVRRVVLADRSALVADTIEAGDSVAAWIRPGDTLVTATDGSLSTGLVRALRAARAFRDRADSVELVIVSPFVAASVDPATPMVRGAWRGRARLVPVTPVRPVVGGVEASLGPDDPLTAAIALAGIPPRPDARVRLIRGAPTPADSSFARAGGALVTWTARGAGTDAVLALVAGDIAVVDRFARLAPADGGVVVARWMDGGPAATERPLGAGCVREVAVAFPAAGDLPMRHAMQRIVRRLLAPCGGARDCTPLDAETEGMLAGAGGLLATDDLPEPAPARIPAEPWLLAAALAVLALEPLARRSRG